MCEKIRTLDNRGYIKTLWKSSDINQ